MAKKYELVGGQPVEVEPLEATEAGTYRAPLGKAYNPVTVQDTVAIESLSATENKTYTAPLGKAYSPVTVNVPNTYAAGDEGKVVSNGALVAQTSATYTENDTYDTTLINSVTVNVAGAQSVATGTITFPEAQSTTPPLTSAVSITHNLGRTPIGVAWTIENTDAANIGGSTYNKSVVGINLVGGEIITENNYIGFMNTNSYSATVNSMVWPSNATSPQYVFASLNCNDTTCLLFEANAYRLTGTIPADTTIRWFVW